MTRLTVGVTHDGHPLEARLLTDGALELVAEIEGAFAAARAELLAAGTARRGRAANGAADAGVALTTFSSVLGGRTQQLERRASEAPGAEDALTEALFGLGLGPEPEPGPRTGAGRARTRTRACRP